MRHSFRLRRTGTGFHANEVQRADPHQAGELVDLGMLPVIGLELPSTMHEWASSLLERSEGFFRRNGGKNFDVIEWIFRLGR